MNNIKIVWAWLLGVLMPIYQVQASHWVCNPSDYQYDMVAYVCLQIDGEMTEATSNHEIAAFVGNECRGVTRIDTIQTTGAIYYSMRIRSNVETGEVVSFRYYDVKENIEKDISTTLDFVSQSINGYPSSPVVLKVFNRYELTFLLDGAVYATDSVVFGDSIHIPKVPDKKGYTFSGWGGVMETMPARNLICQASYILNDTQIDEQGLIYQLNETKDAFLVFGYTNGLLSEVVIPETLYGLPVNAVQERALADALALKSIVVPMTISEIGLGVFCGCYNLLVVEWETEILLDAVFFDEAFKYGNMLVFVNDAERPIGFEGNVVVDGVSEKITLVDGLPFRNPKDFTAKYISYNREFTKKTKVGESSGWEGVVLPFDVQNISHEVKGSLAPFTSLVEGIPCWVAEWLSNSATFILTSRNMANQPFIMEVPNSEDYEEDFNIEGTVTFEARNVTVYATTNMAQVTGNGYSLQASYEGVKADSHVYALNDEEYTTDQNEVYMPGGVFVAESRDIRPFEAYIYNNQLTRSRYLPIKGDTVQGMDTLMKEKTELVDVYTLQGIMMKRQIPLDDLKNELPQGIYIVDGKKVVVR